MIVVVLINSGSVLKGSYDVLVIVVDSWWIVYKVCDLFKLIWDMVV